MYNSGIAAQQSQNGEFEKQEQAAREPAEGKEKPKYMDITKDIVSPKDMEDLLPIDHVAEAKLIRKLDFMIVPPVMLLYLFSFLDRVREQVPGVTWKLTPTGQHWKCEAL
jgi:hypothetical protein